MTKIYFRVDGDNSIGYGHIIRSLALAEILSDLYEISFITSSSNIFIKSQLLEHKFNIIQIPVLENNIDEINFISNIIFLNKPIIILDGYSFTYEYQLKIKKICSQLICIDDLHIIHFCADIIINTAENISSVLYQTESHTKFCLGYKWVLLRAPFITNNITNPINNISDIFISIGGAYLKNILPQILFAIENIDCIKNIHFLIGSELIFNEEVYPIISISKKNYSIYKNLNAFELFSLFKKCQIAFCPASTLSIEACSVGIGLFSGYTADNQINNYNGLISKNVIFGLGDLRNQSIYEIQTLIQHNCSIIKINNLIKRQHTLFDGKISQRYIDLFNNLANA